MSRLIGLVFTVILGSALPAWAVPTCTTNGTPAVAANGQPVSVEVTVGDNATFYVTPADSTSDTNCKYVNLQWQYYNTTNHTWTDLADGTQGGATLNTAHPYQISGVTSLANGGELIRVSITDPGPLANSIVSNTVSVTVDVTPTIVTAPTDQTVLEGHPATFSVTVGGSPTPSVQWQYSKDGSTWFNFPAAPNAVTQPDADNGYTSTLTTPNVLANLNGAYFQAIATNTLSHDPNGTTTGTVTGGPARLYVTIPGAWYNSGTLPGEIGIESFTRGVLLPNGNLMAIGSDFNNLSGGDPTDQHSKNIYLDTTPGYGNDPDTWQLASVQLPNPLQRPTATLLPTGEVLIAGGANGTVDEAGAYVFGNDHGHSWLRALDHGMATARDSHTATLLKTGKVLVVGGVSGGLAISSAELYDPATETWTTAAPMSVARYLHTATLLADGTVLVTGGTSSTGGYSSALNTASIYNPATDTWTAVGNMNVAREYHTATLLADGTVLIAGGTTGHASLASAEIYNPTSKTFTLLSGVMAQDRNQHTATLLANGQVLLAGGSSSTGYTGESELYDPLTKTFAVTQTMTTPRDRSAAVMVQNGKVIKVGGTTTADVSTNSTEKFDSQSLTLPIVPAPSILLGTTAGLTADATANNHTSAVCSVETADPTVTYVWTAKNGVINSGQGTGTIDFSPVLNATGHVDLYCMATDGVGISVVTKAEEQILNLPSVVSGPTNLNIIAGTQAVFSVQVAGYPLPTVAWQYSKDGTNWFPFPGTGTVVQPSWHNSFTASLTTPAVVENLNGAYFRALLTNNVDSLTGEPASVPSAGATLGVNAPPSVTLSMNPSTGIVDQGGTVTLTATASGDVNPTYTYTWYGPNVSGAVGNTLTLTNLQGSDAGSYTVVAHNANTVTGATPLTTTQDSAMSNAQVVQVQTPAQIIEGPDNVSVLNGTPATFTVTVSGVPTPTVSWQYSKDGTNWFPFPSTGTLQQPSSLNSYMGTLTTPNVMANLNGAFFRAIATNTSAASSTVWPSTPAGPAILTVITVPTGVTVTPSSSEISQGQSTTFTASTTPTTPAGQTATYVWCMGSTPSTDPNACTQVSGSDYTVSGNQLTVNNAVLADSNTFFVQAYDASVQPTGVNSPYVVSSAIPLIIDAGSWSQNGTLDSARYEAMGVMLPTTFPTKPKFWIAGGQNDSGLLNNDDVFTPGTGWASSGNMFTAGPHLDGTATLLPSGNVLVVGGSNGQDGQYGIETYNSTTQQYSVDSSTLLYPTTQHVAAFLPSQKVLVAGGSNGWSDTFYNTAYLYNPAGTPTLTASSGLLGVARAGSTSTVLQDGRVLITGGQDVTGVDNAVDIYDATSPSVVYYNNSVYAATGSTGDEFASANCAATTINNTDLPHPNGPPGTPLVGTMCLNTARLYHTATLLNDGRVLIVGGTDGNTALSSIEIWSPTLNDNQGGFQVLGNLATGRMGHSAELLETGKVLIFGGEDADGNALKTAELVDPNYPGLSTGIASIPAGPMLVNRMLAQSATLTDGSVLVAGGVDPTAAQTPTNKTSEDYTALEGYTPTIYSTDDTVSMSSLGTVTPSSTGNSASVSDSGKGRLTHYTWVIGGNGSVTSGQGTSSITYTASSSSTTSVTALVTDQWGHSQYVSGTTTAPPAACPAATGTVTTYNGYLSPWGGSGNKTISQNATGGVYINNLTMPNTSNGNISLSRYGSGSNPKYTITWSASGGSPSFNSYFGGHGQDLSDLETVTFGRSGTGITITATVNVTCSNGQTSSTPLTITGITVQGSR